MSKFLEVKEKHIARLSQFVPIVSRVHGPSHPEFYEVEKVFNDIKEKLDTNNLNALNEDFNKLRSITSDYKIPNDVCESYEAVYDMLNKLDKAYFDNR